MILLAGIRSESPMRMVSEALDRIGHPYIYWDQRKIADCHMDFEIYGGEISGAISVGGIQIGLHEITGAYVRIMDDSLLPELKGLPQSALEFRHSSAQHEALMLWLDLTEARVANQPSANASNGSKPWQTRLIEAAGIRTPDTIVTNSPESVRDFGKHHGELIYKSASGCRSIVKPLGIEDDDRLEAIRWCPVQFQRRIPGNDVRVHVVGTHVFATRVISTASDYRYAIRDGLDSKLEAIDLPLSLTEACIKLSRHLGLCFAGIDLRVQEDGTVWCFEVNPCPGFSFYESHTGQPISDAVARYLACID